MIWYVPKILFYFLIQNEITLYFGFWCNFMFIKLWNLKRVFILYCKLRVTKNKKQQNEREREIKGEIKKNNKVNLKKILRRLDNNNKK